MKNELVFIKATAPLYCGFKHLGESIPDKATIEKAIEHKIFMTPEQAKTARANKKMLYSFLTVRVLGENTLAELESENGASIVLAFPVTRKAVKGNAGSLFFIQSVKDFALTIYTPEELGDTHLAYNGTINGDSVFGIHYTLHIPKELADKFAEKCPVFTKFTKISTLQSYKAFDEISGYVVEHYKEVEETHNEDNKMQS